MNTFMHSQLIMRENEMFYKSKLSLTPKRKVASYVGRLCEEGKTLRGRKNFAYRKFRITLASIFANEVGGIIWIDFFNFR